MQSFTHAALLGAGSAVALVGIPLMTRFVEAAIDVEVAALGRLSAELTEPLDELAVTGQLSPANRRAIARVASDATLFEFVSATRVYRPDGRPIFPLDAPPAQSEVHRVLAGDNLVRVESGAQITAYTPDYTNNEHAYVIAVDFAAGQLSAASGRERTQLFSVVGAVSANSFISLLTLAAGASRELERRRREAQQTFVQTLGIMAEVIICAIRIPRAIRSESRPIAGNSPPRSASTTG